MAPWSRVLFAPKKQSEVVVQYDAQRTIYTLDPFGKGFFKQLYKRLEVPQALPNEYGYLRGRRREAAIKQQLALQWRLHANYFSQDFVSYDMRNAFASLSIVVACRVLSFIADADDWPLLEQRLTCASACVAALGGSVMYAISCILPGDQIAADIFSVVFRVAALGDWVRGSDQDPSVNLRCVVTNRLVDVSRSAYADDLCKRNKYETKTHKKTLIAPSFKEVRNKLGGCSRAVSEAVQPLDVAKQEIVVDIRGKYARDTQRQLCTHGTPIISNKLKYLGAWMTGEGSNSPEAKARLSAAWCRWKVFTSLWYSSDIPTKVRIIFVRCPCLQHASLVA